jgi:hypothetical protein
MGIFTRGIKCTTLAKTAELIDTRDSLIEQDFLSDVDGGDWEHKATPCSELVFSSILRGEMAGDIIAFIEATLERMCMVSVDHYYACTHSLTHSLTH